MGSFSTGVKCSRQQGGETDSPNAGFVMAAGAGALKITMGGAANYQGKIHQRPVFGIGPAVESNDVERAISLVERSMILWLVALLLLGLL